MVLIPGRCPPCQSADSMKGGTTKTGTQRSKGLNATCPHYALQFDLIDKGRYPAIKEQIIAMALHGRGIRDTARVLQISPTTVLNALQKKRQRSAVCLATSASWPGCRPRAADEGGAVRNMRARRGSA
jgi:insertion element IS1 protein InsB